MISAAVFRGPASLPVPQFLRHAQRNIKVSSKYAVNRESTNRTLQTWGWTRHAPRRTPAQSHLICLPSPQLSVFPLHLCFLYTGITVLTKTKSGTGIVSTQAACFGAAGQQNLSKHRDGSVSYTVALPGGLTKPADLKEIILDFVSNDVTTHRYHTRDKTKDLQFLNTFSLTGADTLMIDLCNLSL